MFLVFIIYVFQLTNKIHDLNFELKLLDRRLLTIKCRAALLFIRVKIIRWLSLSNKIWQSLHQHNNCKREIRSIISMKKRESKIHRYKIQKIHWIHYIERKSFNYEKNHRQNHRKINKNHRRRYRNWNIKNCYNSIIKIKFFDEMQKNRCTHSKNATTILTSFNERNNFIRINKKNTKTNEKSLKIKKRNWSNARLSKYTKTK